jgi:hypothetical protein
MFYLSINYSNLFHKNFVPTAFPPIFIIVRIPVVRSRVAQWSLKLLGPGAI